MNYLNGGYVMLDKADSDIFAKASGALKAGKPILWYEDKNTCYYIDTLAKSGDDIVLTKGGKTITITDANVVTESGEIQQHLYAYVIDIEATTSSGVTFPNGHYATILSDKEFTNTIEDGEYICLNGSYEKDSVIILIFKLSISEGTIDSVYDSSDYNGSISTDFDNSIYAKLGKVF